MPAYLATAKVESAWTKARGLHPSRYPQGPPGFRLDGAVRTGLAPLAEVLRAMTDRRIGTALVTRNDKLVGIYDFVEDDPFRDDNDLGGDVHGQRLSVWFQPQGGRFG